MLIVKIIGGLGNQMFQYAFYRMLKERYTNVKMDVFGFDKYKLHNGFELINIFENILTDYADREDILNLSNQNRYFSGKLLKKILRVKKSTHYIEKELNYVNPDVFIKDDIYLDGYWQSEKYFSNIKDIIADEFEFPKFTTIKNENIFKKIINEESVSIHVRRGDYVGNNLYSGICTMNYYKNAIKFIKANVNQPFFYVFSDDIDWCKNNLGIYEKVIYIDWNRNNDSYRDMQLMSLCKHNIIANSSFSWWGAWLNRNLNKIVCTPNRWLSNNKSNISDIVPENWIKIKA